MRKLILFFLVLFASPVNAQAIRVQTGEHGSFTRVAMVFSEPVEWRLGRNDDGYSLEIKGNEQSFDLSTVFDLIDRNRLRAIWADPETGWLHMGVACDCHAIGFEADARTLVIDIRDGKPAAQSAFEISMTSEEPLPPLVAPSLPRPKSRPETSPAAQTYSWLDHRLSENALPAKKRVETTMLAPPPFDTRPVAEMREKLVMELGKQASSGVVHLAPIDDQIPELTDPPLSTRRLAGVDIRIDDRSLGTDGRACPSEEEVNPLTWSTDGDAFGKMAAARNHILGEFDSPSRQAVVAAARTYVFFGFGAEARNLLAQFGEEAEPDKILIALSQIVEGGVPTPNPFEGVQSCDGASALWALLAAQTGEQLPGLNTGAVVQSVSTLPQTLRVVLGTAAHDRLIALGEISSARMVEAATKRISAPDDPSQALLRASQAIALGQAGQAEAEIGRINPKDRGAKALVMLADAMFEQRKPMNTNDLVALEARFFELGPDHEDGPGMSRALMRMRALSGDFRGALDLATPDTVLWSEFWQLLVEQGADGMLLAQAAEIEEATLANLPSPVVNLVGQRLLELGLPDLAEPWLKHGPGNADANLRLALLRSDAAGLEALMADGELPDDPSLRAAAFLTTSRFDRLAELRAQSGDLAGAQRARRWAGTWDGSTQSDADKPWSAVAEIARPLPANDTESGPLAAGRNLLTRSEVTKARVTDLFQAIRPSE